MYIMKAAPKILAVDDSASIRRSMAFIFTAPRYDVISAPDANEALARLAATPDTYDVIIVDQKMPWLTGVELVQEIRNQAIRVKILVLSAYLSAEVREAYEKMHVNVILDKPFNIDELRLAVDRLAA
jgi:DNA-binding response OmpR family regulator